MGSISLRDSIRWLPEPASEPTSTLVITSPKRNFVDIRVLRPEGSASNWPTSEEKVPLDRIDWLIAGTSLSWSREAGKVSRGQWRHWIDSRTTDTADLADEGDMYPQADGTTLEVGRMENPETGKETDYEEVWRDLNAFPEGLDDPLEAITVQIDQGDEAKGSVVRLGGFCQGFLRKGERLSAERWVWIDGGAGWKRTISIGEDELPCSQVLVSKSKWHVGDSVAVGEDKWKVIEVSEHFKNRL